MLCAFFLLQSCHMAFDKVSEDAVYACTGNPMPRDIEQVVNWLFNEPLADTYKSEFSLLSAGMVDSM